VVEFEFISDVTKLADAWSSLSESNGNVFSGWDWAMLWWRHFGRGRRLFVGVVRKAGATKAIVPLYAWRERPLRVLRFIGHGHGDLLGPVCAPGDETAHEAMRAALARSEFDVFVGDWLLADEQWADDLGGHTLRETGYPIIRFHERTWDEFLAARSRSFRKDARGEMRKLEREHEVRIRSVSDPAGLDSALDTIFSLHRGRFGDHQGCYFCGEHEPFQRAFAARALERGWLRADIMELDGRPVCAEYGFRFGDAHFAYQCGRDPAWDRASVGSALETYTIKRALEEGAREFRFLQGSESYKYRIANEDPELETIAVGGSRLGRLAVSATAAMRHVRPLAAVAKRAAT
jgi:CelD/BcsL family acetyltransferase involved in cellulose biosynthesis